MGVKARVLLKSPGCLLYCAPCKFRVSRTFFREESTWCEAFRAKIIQNYGYFGQFPWIWRISFEKMKMYLYLAEDTGGVHPAGLVHGIERWRCTCILPRIPVESIRLASFTVSKDEDVPVSCRGYQWSPYDWPRSLYRPRYRTPASWLRLHRTLQPATSQFIKQGDFFEIFFSVYCYSTLLHLPPLRFHCIGGYWDRTQDFGDFGIGSQTLLPLG